MHAMNLRGAKSGDSVQKRQIEYSYPRTDILIDFNAGLKKSGSIVFK